MSEHRVLGLPVGELASAEIDHALSQAQAAALTAHLGQCDSCSSLRARLRAGSQQLMPGSRDGSSDERRAQQESLARIRSAVTQPTRMAEFGRSAFVMAAVVALLAVVIIWPRVQAANPSIPDREVVATHSELKGDATITLTIEQGRLAARAGQNTGVLGRAEVRLTAPATAGTVEIRFREGADAYGIIATTRDITGSSLLRIEGSFPPLERGSVHRYAVWVHLETATAVLDTDVTSVDVQGGPDGERARTSAN